MQLAGKTIWKAPGEGIIQYVTTIIPSACCCRYQDNEDMMVSHKYQWASRCSCRLKNDHSGPFYTILAILDHFGRALLFKKTGSFKILAKSLCNKLAMGGIIQHRCHYLISFSYCCRYEDNEDTCIMVALINTHVPLAVAVDANELARLYGRHDTALLPLSISFSDCCRYENNEDRMVALINTHRPFAVGVDATSWQDYMEGMIQHHYHYLSLFLTVAGMKTMKI